MLLIIIDRSAATTTTSRVFLPKLALIVEFLHLISRIAWSMVAVAVLFAFFLGIVAPLQSRSGKHTKQAIRNENDNRRSTLVYTLLSSSLVLINNKTNSQFEKFGQSRALDTLAKVGNTCLLCVCVCVCVRAALPY